MTARIKTASLSPCHYPQPAAPMGQSQRDCDLQPRVARHELPWENHVVAHQPQPESMRKAVTDVMEACSHARARAILDGVQTDLVIYPSAGRFEVVSGGGSAPEQDRLFSPDVAGHDWRTPPKTAAGGAGGGG